MYIFVTVELINMDYLLKSIWYVYVVFTNPGNYILYNNKTILAQDSLNTIYWGNSRDI